MLDAAIISRFWSKVDERGPHGPRPEPQEGQEREVPMPQGNSRPVASLDRARLLRDVEPAVVARHVASRAAWAERIGYPRRCETNEVQPGLGCCLLCEADSGENCRESRA